MRTEHNAPVLSLAQHFCGYYILSGHPNNWRHHLGPRISVERLLFVFSWKYFVCNVLMLDPIITLAIFICRE